MQSVTIQLVTWNSASALHTSLPFLQTVDSDVAKIQVIDNASSDDSVALIKQYLPQAQIIQLATNTGFAGGHNEGFRRCTTPFVLVLNPDTQLHWSGIKTALGLFADKKIAALQGKLYRTNNKIFDSVGVILSLAFNGRERGAGQADTGQYEATETVAAVTGACALYRLTALRQVAHHHDEIFDEDFFAYKEDVDLGWRLRRAGWKVVYTPTVFGIHERSLKNEGRWGWKVSATSVRRRLMDRRTIYSLRSWVWMIVKNASALQLMSHAPWIMARGGIFIFLTLFYWPLVRAWFEIGRGIPRMIAKRRTSS